MGHPDHVVALVEQQTAVAEEPPGTPPVQVGGPTEELPQQPATLVSGR
ncbi:hypothetical protein [Micromonospora sp. NPDC005291]